MDNRVANGNVDVVRFDAIAVPTKEILRPHSLFIVLERPDTAEKVHLLGREMVDGQPRWSAVDRHRVRGRHISHVRASPSSMASMAWKMLHWAKVVNSHQHLAIGMHRRITALLLVFTLIPGAAVGQEANADSQEAPESRNRKVSVRDIVGDNLIQERIERIFESAGWYSSLRIDSSEGIVKIDGIADTKGHRQWAAKVASDTEGVVAVINQLDVRDDVSLQGSRQIIETSLDRLWRDFLGRSPLLIAAVIILLLTAGVSKLLTFIERKLLEKSRLRSSLQDLVYQLTSLAIWVIGFFTALIVAFPGMTPAKALTTLGLGTVAVGFAFKDIFENFFAGVLILWRYPFDRGDFIECGDIDGKVEEITIRNTLIRRLDGELAVVPNAYLFKNNVNVLTSQPQRRVRIICGVAYGEDLDHAREIIRDAVAACDTVQGKRTIEVFAQEFADSSINFEVAWWTGAKPQNIRSSRDEVVASIKRGLDAAGIEIPFPYRTLTFQNEKVSTAVSQLVAGREGYEEAGAS